MSDFDQAYRATIGHEGGYANVTGDRGGETYKGIARQFHPKWMGWPMIDAQKKRTNFPASLSGLMMLEILVEKFYFKEFWICFNISMIDSQQVAAEVFDTAVNCGPKSAIRFLQEAMNLCNQNTELYKELSVDGRIGPHTATAVNAFPAGRIDVLLKVLNLLQGEHYLNICRKDPSQEKFLHGWVANRINLKS